MTSNVFAIYICIQILINIHTDIIIIQGPPKKCIHTLTKENSVLYVSTKFNYTSQVEYKLQQSTIQVTTEHNTSYNRAQYKFPVPVQLMEVLKVVAVSG
jgi:hypothetical protein